MRNISLLVGVAATALTLAAPLASAGDYQPYVSVFGGGSFLNSPKFNFDVGQSWYELQPNMGYIIGGAIGMNLPDHLRAEVELSHSAWNIFQTTDQCCGSRSASGPLSATYLLGNIWFDIPVGTGFQPYVGGGAGIGFANASFNANLPWNGGNSGFAFQLGAGIKVPVSENINVDLGYRFIDLGGVVVPGNGFTYNGGTLASHNVQIGLTYQF